MVNLSPRISSGITPTHFYPLYKALRETIFPSFYKLSSSPEISSIQTHKAFLVTKLSIPFFQEISENFSKGFRDYHTS